MSLVISRGFGAEGGTRPPQVIKVCRFRIRIRPKVRFRVKIRVKEGAPSEC